MIWIIIIAVILLIVLAVNIPVTAYIRYHDGEADPMYPNAVNSWRSALLRC